jgi:hypothetical protein
VLRDGQDHVHEGFFSTYMENSESSLNDVD